MNKKEYLCPRCGKPLSKSDVKGYEFVCYDCDENFYRVEANAKIDMWVPKAKE